MLNNFRNIIHHDEFDCIEKELIHIGNGCIGLQERVKAMFLYIDRFNKNDQKNNRSDEEIRARSIQKPFRKVCENYYFFLMENIKLNNNLYDIYIYFTVCNGMRLIKDFATKEIKKSIELH